MSDAIKKSAIVFKQRAKELGYEIKLTHCQEILAKVNGHKTRHSLLKDADMEDHDADTIISYFSKDNVIFNKNDFSDPKFKKIFMESLFKELQSSQIKGINVDEFIFSFKSALSQPSNYIYSIHTYLKSLDKGNFKDTFYFGLIRPESNWIENLKSGFKGPNGLFAGAMGVGKSQSMKTTLATWLLSNGDHTSINIVNLIKDCSDYRPLLNYQQVTEISNHNSFLKLLDDTYSEAIARINKFREININNLQEYESKTKQSLTRIVIAMDEFQTIPFISLNFQNDYLIEGTPAFKLYNLMRIGRNIGIWILAATQRATASDVPKEILPNFTQKQVFRVSKGESSYLLGTMDAAAIEKKGHCLTEYGKVVFPLFDDLFLTFLLSKYVKPLSSKMILST